VQALLDPVTGLQSPDSSVDCNCPNQSPAPLLPGSQSVARRGVITLKMSSSSLFVSSGPSSCKSQEIARRISGPMSCSVLNPA
jgi:hypothetical protein